MTLLSLVGEQRIWGLIILVIGMHTGFIISNWTEIIEWLEIKVESREIKNKV